jgi:sugar/nucleoside kinase (ribokinase family)
MKILGIGNAIVDVICKVSDQYLVENSLIKSTMKLVNEDEFKKILTTLKIEETVSGGSVANSIVGLSQLGNNVGFIGKINADELGQKYEEGLIKEKVQYFYKKRIETSPTGTCLVLITPDAERTMVVFLGIAGKISEKDIDEKIVKESEMTFLEGYLWDEGEPKTAFDKVMLLSKKKAMSLSDQFCVERHKENFLDLVKNKLDITFANEQEIKSLIDTKNFEEVVAFGKQLGRILIITRGENGSVAIKNDDVVECKSKTNLKIVDLTGAGDLFAAGFLHGFINNYSMKESLEKGTEMSSKIIQKVGARLN